MLLGRDTLAGLLPMRSLPCFLSIINTSIIPSRPSIKFRTADSSESEAEHDKDATGTTKLLVHTDELGSFPNIFLTLDLLCDTADFDFEGLTVGKAALVDIGTGGTQGVAKSAKGAMIVRDSMLLNLTDDIVGSGTISSSLWLPATKYVNQNSWTADQIINTGDSHQKSLTQILEAKGFTDATP